MTLTYINFVSLSELQKKSHSLFKSGHNLKCPAIVD